WAESVKTAPYSYSSFVMASESDKTVSVDFNTEEEPATVTVDVERMAARVDYKTPSTIEIKEDEDNSIDGDDAFMGATIKITGAAIVNNLTAGSYMLKRVNTGKGTSVTYLGEETDTSGVATNYVIDPWTEQKTGDVLSSLYGIYYPGTPATTEQKNPSYWDALVSSDNIVAVTDDDGSVWNRIGYTMENTTYSDYTSKQYASAVIFKALFTPTEGMVHDSFYSGYGFSYTIGTTFFKWNNNLYATPEDMMAAAYPGTFTLGSSEYGDRFAGKISSCTTWSNITTFANTLSEDDPTGYKNYLLSQASGKSGSLTDANKSVLTWDYYMKEEIGYTIITSGNTVTGFNIGTTSRAALAAATNDAVGTYEDAQCYYTWWIRHSNDDNNDTNGTMEFAIVRNNIYKLEIASAFSIGGDIPTEGIHVVVTVKTWLLYDTDIINL
ncbi:MAG: Mfa1 fimbrilin C-terminal domain-containing protein, partial [Prevotella sp.]|nr:Mfa1 fimbrilin C-terminal domain-containing protein [Prevotella sp.]